MKLGTTLAVALALFVVCAAAVANNPQSATITAAEPAPQVVDPAAKAVAAAKEQTEAALKKVEETSQKLTDVSDALHYTKIDLETKNSRLADAVTAQRRAEAKARKARQLLAAEKARQNILRTLSYHAVTPASAAVQTPQQRRAANVVPKKTVKSKLQLVHTALPANLKSAQARYSKLIAAAINLPETRVVIGEFTLRNVTLKTETANATAPTPAATTAFLETEIEIEGEAEAEGEADADVDADAENDFVSQFAHETVEADQVMFGESLASVGETFGEDVYGMAEHEAEEEAMLAASAEEAFVLAEGAARAQLEDEMDSESADTPTEAPATPDAAPKPSVVPPPATPTGPTTETPATPQPPQPPQPPAPETTPEAPAEETPAEEPAAPVVPSPPVVSEPKTRTVVRFNFTILPGTRDTSEPSDAAFNHLVNKLKSGELNKLIPEVDQSFIPKALIITHTKDENTGAPMDVPKKNTGEPVLVRAVVLESNPVGYTVRTEPEWLAVEGGFQVPEYVSTPVVAFVPPTIL